MDSRQSGGYQKKFKCNLQIANLRVFLGPLN